MAYITPETLNGLNLYAYCGNNPVMNADPTGRLFLTTLLIGGLIGAVVGFTSSIIIQGITYGFSNINWGVVALDTLFGAVSGLINVSPIGIIGQMTIGGIMSTAQ